MLIVFVKFCKVILVDGQAWNKNSGAGDLSLARRSKDVNQSRRLLSLAAVRDGMDRALKR
jgi:hypothetical protein